MLISNCHLISSTSVTGSATSGGGNVWLLSLGGRATAGPRRHDRRTRLRRSYRAIVLVAGAGLKVPPTLVYQVILDDGAPCRVLGVVLLHSDCPAPPIKVPDPILHLRNEDVLLLGGESPFIRSFDCSAHFVGRWFDDVHSTETTTVKTGYFGRRLGFYGRRLGFYGQRLGFCSLRFLHHGK